MLMNRLLFYLGASFTFGALAACQGSPASAPWFPPAGQSQAFNDGYVQGCLSGYRDAGRDGTIIEQRNDEQRYAADAEYRAGFDRAHAACYEDEKLHPRVLGGGNSNQG